MFLKRIRQFGARAFRKAASILDEERNIRKHSWFEIESGPLKGAKFFGDVNDTLTHAMRTGCYETFFYEALANTGFEWPGKNVWDVGAHVGYHTLMFARLVGDSGHVSAFEPNPRNIELLNEHRLRNPELARRISLATIALADVNREELFHYSVADGETDLGYLDATGTPSDRISQSVYQSFLESPVSVRTADSLLEGHEQGAPNFVKIDVEGAEYNVLRGAANLLRSCRPVLAIEIHNVRALFNVMNLLFQYGYATKIIDDPYDSSSRAFLISMPTNPLDATSDPNRTAVGHLDMAADSQSLDRILRADAPPLEI